MRFSVQVLAIAATVFSMNAVPQALEPVHGVRLHAPAAMAAAGVAEPNAPLDPRLPDGAAWPLAVAFLALVVMRRMRS
jgi:hypothetical protein